MLRPLDRDYRSMGWAPNGQVIALRNGLRATLWQFQPTHGK